MVKIWGNIINYYYFHFLYIAPVHTVKLLNSIVCQQLNECVKIPANQNTEVKIMALLEPHMLIGR